MYVSPATFHCEYLLAHFGVPYLCMVFAGPIPKQPVPQTGDCDVQRFAESLQQEL